MKVRFKQFNINWWNLDGANIQRQNLCNQSSVFFLIDPVAIDGLGGDKVSVLTKADIDGTLKYQTSGTFEAIAENFSDANWTANGWTVGNLTEINDWVLNNFNNNAINPSLRDMSVGYTRGTLNGTPYTVAFAFMGNQGIDLGPDGETSLYLQFNGNITDSSNYALSTTANVSAPAYVTGVAGQAADLTSWVQVNQPGDLPLTQFDFGSGNWTIEFWWKPDVLGGNWVGYDQSGSRRILAKQASSPFAFDWRIATLSPNVTASNIGGTLNLTSTNHSMVMEFVGLTGGGDGGWLLVQWDTVGIDTTNFHHVALVKNGDVITGYFNGVASGSKSGVSGNLQNSGNRYLKIGTEGGFAGGYGVWDEVRISKGIARYNGNFTPVAPY